MNRDLKSYRTTEAKRIEAAIRERSIPESSRNFAGNMPRVAAIKPPEAVAFKEYQDFLRSRLSQPAIRLIPQLTGVRCHVWWHGLLDRCGYGDGAGENPVDRPSAIENALPAGVCECCWPELRAPSRSRDRPDRQFLGNCGLTTFYTCLRVDQACLLTFILQAKMVPSAGTNVSLAGFRQAVTLVRLLRRDLESIARVYQTERELAQAVQRLNRAETEAAHLRGELRQRLPGLAAATVQPNMGSRARKLVERMFEYVQQNTHRPISLGEMAATMKMNASYLSDLFRQTTGVTFHHFYQEVRLAKAKALLRDPRKLVCEVACAVGYASPDAFRHAFKAREGLSPEAWRAGA